MNKELIKTRVDSIVDHIQNLIGDEIPDIVDEYLPKDFDEFTEKDERRKTKILNKAYGKAYAEVKKALIKKL